MIALNLDALDLPRLTLPQRLREACRLAWQTLTTGRRAVAEAYRDGIDVGMDGGYAAALSEFNAALVAHGIDPVRKPGGAS